MSEDDIVSNMKPTAKLARLFEDLADVLGRYDAVIYAEDPFWSSDSCVLYVEEEMNGYVDVLMELDGGECRKISRLLKLHKYVWKVKEIYLYLIWSWNTN